MAQKAELISSGEIVEVSAEMDYSVHTIWLLDTSTKIEYSPSELKFLPDNTITSSIESALSQYTDEELKEELKRRDKERQAKYPKGVHCRDCKHCGEGYAYKHQRNKTMVCFAKPKPKMAPNCFYATSLSCKACDKFEVKHL